MNRITTLIAASATLLAIAAPMAASAAPWQTINARQDRIETRINQGIRSGALNRNEAARLRTDFRALSRMEAQYRRSGGGLNARERTDLDRRFDALSARVQVQKNDRQYRR